MLSNIDSIIKEKKYFWKGEILKDYTHANYTKY